MRRLTHTPGYDGGAFFSADCSKLVWRASRPSRRKGARGLSGPLAKAPGSSDARSSSGWQTPTAATRGRSPISVSRRSDRRSFPAANASFSRRTIRIRAAASSTCGRSNADGSGARADHVHSRVSTAFRCFLRTASGSPLPRIGTRKSRGYRRLRGSLRHRGEAPASREQLIGSGTTSAWLADDMRQGRGLGSAGLVQAADWLEQQFRAIGLEASGGSYRHAFDVTVGVKASRQDGAFPCRSAGAPRSLHAARFFERRCGRRSVTVAAGHGITAPELRFDDYKGIKAKDRIVVVRRFAPHRARRSTRPRRSGVSATCATRPGTRANTARAR